MSDAYSPPGRTPTAAPGPLVAREATLAALTDVVTADTRQHVVLTGPRGSGKTLCCRHARQALPDTTAECYVSGIAYPTQYQVLRRLYTLLTDAPLNTGYHTAQLTTRVEQVLTERDAVLVLDDVEFLLQRDGDALLYTLSRLAPAQPLRVVLVSAQPSVTTGLDGRTASSLAPQRRTLEPYTVEETARILGTFADSAALRPVTDAALLEIARTTQNVRVGQGWLDRADEVTPSGPITAADVQGLRVDALQRYRTTMLTAFTRHHALLLRAVEHLTADGGAANSGRVFERYATLCRVRQVERVSTRQCSKYLHHLELLGLVDIEYHYGGPEGKTRLCRPTGLEEV